MSRDLHAAIHSFLGDHGAATASEIALGVRARRSDVVDALSSVAFCRAETPVGGNHRSAYFRASGTVPQTENGTRETRPSQNARILAVLGEGGWWTTAEIHRLAGFSRLNSRIAEIRSRGYEIECERIEGVPAGPHAQAYRLLATPESVAGEAA